MARHAASTGDNEDFAVLPDHDPVHVRLLEINRLEKTQFKKSTDPNVKEWRLTYKWEQVGSNAWIFDYTSTSIGATKSGVVSNLRQIINAIHGRASNSHVAWFDDETFEYGLDGDGTDAPVAGRLAPGVEIVVRGLNETKTVNGEPRSVYNIKFYQPLPAVAQAANAPTQTTIAAPQAPPAAPAAAATPAPALEPAAPAAAAMADF